VGTEEEGCIGGVGGRIEEEGVGLIMGRAWGVGLIMGRAWGVGLIMERVWG
jgi:hypothetical protein